MKLFVNSFLFPCVGFIPRPSSVSWLQATFRTPKNERSWDAVARNAVETEHDMIRVQRPVWQCRTGVARSASGRGPGEAGSGYTDRRSLRSELCRRRRQTSPCLLLFSRCFMSQQLYVLTSRPRYRSHLRLHVTAHALRTKSDSIHQSPQSEANYAVYRRHPKRSLLWSQGPVTGSHRQINSDPLIVLS